MNIFLLEKLFKHKEFHKNKSLAKELWEIMGCSRHLSDSDIIAKISLEIDDELFEDLRIQALKNKSQNADRGWKKRRSRLFFLYPMVRGLFRN